MKELPVSQKSLTIIVPSYNMERYLPRCLGSLVVAPEWRSRLDVLVVNDGSCDQTSRIAHEFEGKYPDVFRVIDKSNGNYGSCINVALTEIKGEFVKVLDADDCFESDGLEKLLEFLARTDVDVVLTDWLDVDGENRELGRSGWNVSNNQAVSIESFLRAHVSAMMFGLTYRSSLFGKMDYHQLEGVSYTDLEWANLPMAVASKVAYLPQVVYKYTAIRKGQTSDLVTKRRNYWMILAMFLDLVRQYERLRPKLIGEHLALVDIRLALKVESFYRQGHVLGAKVDFKKFDQEFAALSPEIHRLAGTFARGRLCFNFVKNFRNGSILARAKIAAYCALVRLKSICRI